MAGGTVSRARASAGRGARRRGLAVLAAGCTSVAVSLALRVIHRGRYYPGWDLVGAAQGLWLVSTTTPGDLLHWYRAHHYDPTIGWNVYSALLALLPGWLTSIRPWEYWAHALTFTCTLASFALVGGAVGLRGAEWGIVLLAWGASSALLSHSITGFAYVSAVLPHALAIWIVLRCGRRPLATLLLTPLAIEVAWHVQELGRTVFVVFLAAAVFVRPASRRARVVWLCGGAWQLWDSLAHPTFNTARYGHLALASDVGARLLALASRIVVERQVDVPVLFLTGVTSVVLVRRHAWFWRALLAAQLGLIVLLAVNDGLLQGVANVWPRRFLLVSFLCLAVTAAFYHERRGRWPAILVAVLLAGNAWQLADTWRWFRQPFDRLATGSDFTLPYTQTTLDYWVPLGAVDFAHEITDLVAQGKKVIVLYNLSSAEENPTNPAGVLERVYLSLGHERFMESVFVFGSRTFRWNTFPVRPLDELQPFLRGVTDPERYVGLAREHPGDPAEFAQDAAAIGAALADRWQIEWEAESERLHDPARVTRFRLRAPGR